MNDPVEAMINDRVSQLHASFSLGPSKKANFTKRSALVKEQRVSTSKCHLLITCAFRLMFFCDDICLLEALERNITFTTLHTVLHTYDRSCKK